MCGIHKDRGVLPEKLRDMHYKEFHLEMLETFKFSLSQPVIMNVPEHTIPLTLQVDMVIFVSVDGSIRR